ncbi:MAG TPA: phage tail protein [Polyangiaceae bacterium]|nr:phage tail protein [Polyangiaceae bacterium]
MDANGTRFHLLLGAGDWGRTTDCSASLLAPGDDPGSVGVALDARSQERTLKALPFRFLASPNDRAPTIDDRRGAARDRFGNWYFIDDDRTRIRVKSAGTRKLSDFWPLPAAPPAPAKSGAFAPLGTPPAPPPGKLAGLAITTHHYLIVGTLAPAGFLVFDLHAGGPPLALAWPAELAFHPFDMIATPDGGVAVLDRDERRFWLLDARFRAAGTGQANDLLVPSAPEDFQSEAPGPVRERAASEFPLGVSWDAGPFATPLAPVAVEAMDDGSLLLLEADAETGSARLLRFVAGAATGVPVPLSLSELVGPGGTATRSIAPHDMAFLPASDEQPARLFVVASDGNQAFAFDLTLVDGTPTLAAANEYFPMRLFEGKALVAAGGNVYYDHPGGFVPLVKQDRPSFVGRGQLVTEALDGGEPDCVWHRLIIDAKIPPGAEVAIATRAANDPDALKLCEFLDEPALYRRGGGAELPFLAPSASGRRESHELLFQRAVGRFLEIRITLTGDGRVTPRLRALRAWFPRFSYLARYLPAAYAEDDASASFVERFLANPEGLLTGIEDRIAGAQVLFDVRSTPAHALEWLASWFGVALDPAWNEARRRLFIRHAMDFFQYRGTIRGLRMALRLALEACADESIFTEPDDPTGSPLRIVEGYRGRNLPGVYAGDVTEAPGIRFVPLADRWTPDQRADSLDQAFTAAMSGAGFPSLAHYPLRAPADTTQAQAWTRFSESTLGFVPAATDADTPTWQAFLANRYLDVKALNTAHGSALTDFSQATLPSELPSAPLALRDWYQFESLLLPMRVTAHRFRVLIPTSFAADDDRAARLELAARIVELEKPAHTAFDVRFYYAMFRVGEARLGFDTLIDLGARAPELLGPFVLGPRHLAEGYLAARPPGDAADRRVLGRDRLQA